MSTEASGGPELRTIIVLTDPGKKKVKVIKEICSFTGLGLKEAKALVDNTPRAIPNLDNRKAENLRRVLGDLGAMTEVRAGTQESSGTDEVIDPEGDFGFATEDPSVAIELAKLKKKVKLSLAENVSDGETIRVVIRGASGQAIVGSDTRAFVLKPGWMAGAAFGAEVTSFSYRNIDGVQVHKGMVSGSVLLQTSSQNNQKTSYWGQGDDDVYKLPNAIPVGGEWTLVKRGAAVLRELITRAHAPVQPASPAAAPAQVSIADELAKLGELKSAGVLSEDEFAQAKSRLLSSDR